MAGALLYSLGHIQGMDLTQASTYTLHAWPRCWSGLSYNTFLALVAESIIARPLPAMLDWPAET